MCFVRNCCFICPLMITPLLHSSSWLSAVLRQNHCCDQSPSPGGIEVKVVNAACWPIAFLGFTSPEKNPTPGNKKTLKVWVFQKEIPNSDREGIFEVNGNSNRLGFGGEHLVNGLSISAGELEFVQGFLSSLSSKPRPRQFLWWSLTKMRWSKPAG